MAIGLATFLPSRLGAVPWGASAITQSMTPSWFSEMTIDSDPAMEPNICKTRSESRSPSRLSVGMTSASPLVAMSRARVASMSCGS